jgi:hypothetical protein
VLLAILFTEIALVLHATVLFLSVFAVFGYFDFSREGNIVKHFSAVGPGFFQKVHFIGPLLFI